MLTFQVSLAKGWLFVFQDLYMKLANILVVAIILFELLVPTDFVIAAQRVFQPQNIVDGVVLDKQYISAAVQSVVMLEGEELEARQQEWVEKQREKKPSIRTTYMTTSAYNSLAAQTDSSPYSTAIGSMTRDGVVATNYFPIGTIIRIPDVYGDKEFRVEDRMNRRYFKTVDIWMEDYSAARQFGRRYLKVEIVKYGLGRGVE